MSLKTDSQVRVLTQRVDELCAIVDALKRDLDVAFAPDQTAEPGLAIPNFPRVLKELGYEPPAGLVEGREVLNSPQLRDPAAPPADTPEALTDSVAEFLDA